MLLAAIVSSESPITRTEMYDFIPYKNGITSLLLTHDLELLERKELITRTKNTFDHKLSKNAIGHVYSLSFDEQQTIQKIVQQNQDYSDIDLVTRTTKISPKFQTPVTKNKTTKITTAGYEGNTIDGFLLRLLSAGIQTIIDVRKNPISRKFGFSKTSMENSANAVGITYMHIPELGIKSESRQNLNCKDDYIKLFDNYEKTTLKETSEYQQLVIEQIIQQPSVLVCFEHKPTDCHRGRLANHLAKLTKLSVTHL
ncbi:DUF488 domain-containing protein [Pseudodesulfovibrio sp. S3]|uniref:DUF488 domain-containing protein n=2 Tax=unclassified Pseudodesulfovibrio TaxID=2661612 RepID=UPI0019D481FC|nr:DUF488 domain-containing protein [Pseudodesulfovibrio sp. S3]